MALLSGRLPYRDYYTAGPPLNQIKSAIELSIFGKAVFVSRASAVVERLCIAVLLYAWLRRSFTGHASLLASVVTIIVSAGDRSDPLASYNHDAILFAMLCGYAACHVLNLPRKRHIVLYAILSGVGAGLSSLTKQTVGLGVAATVLVIVSAYLVLHRPRAFVLWLASYTLGFSAPLLSVALWLHKLGVLSAGLRMLFVTGPSAKASYPGAFLARAIYIARDNEVWVALGLAGVVLTFGAVRRSFDRISLDFNSPVPRRTLLWVTLSFVALFGFAEALSRMRIPAVWNFSKSAVYFTCLGLTIFAVWCLQQVLRETSLPLQAQRRLWEIMILIGVGWSVAVTLALSWPAFEAMTLPGLAVLLAGAMDGVRRGKPALYFMLAVLVSFQLREKLDLPFSFGFQDEMCVHDATERSDQPALAGLRLPAATVQFLDATVALVRHCTAPGDGVFTYPEMGLLYPLTERQPPTWAGSHNIDVVPDALARAEALRLLSRPPKVLVYARPTEDQLAAEENLWRRGHRSGQRELVDALDRLAAQDRLRGTYVLRPGDVPIRVYLHDSADAAESCDNLYAGGSPLR